MLPKRVINIPNKCIWTRANSQISIASNIRSSSTNAWFSDTRLQIVDNLKFNQNDKSLAGKVDPRIKPLVDWINEVPNEYVTSSSCSGRLLLFHRADSCIVPRQKKRGSLGSGKIIETHDPVINVCDAVSSVYLPALRAFAKQRDEQFFPHQITKSEGRNVSCNEMASELLHLQFRPMILHVLARDIRSAVKLLECARESGQNNSGIISCSRFVPSLEGNRGSSSGGSEASSQNEVRKCDDVPQKITCCISSSLCMDVPILSGDRWLLSELEGNATENSPWFKLLEQCIEHANDLFTENFQRLDRFWEQMKKRLIH